MSDIRQRFYIHDCPVRGEVVHLEQSLHTILAQREYPQAIKEEHDGAFGTFVRAESLRTRQAMLDMPLPAEVQARFHALAADSWEAQRKIEASDTMSFDDYLREYFSPEHLGVAEAA